MKKLIITLIGITMITCAFAQQNIPQGGTGLSTSTKGDLLTGTSSIRYSRLPIGGDGTILTASSTSPYGMAWASNIFSSISGFNGFVARFTGTSSLSIGTLLDNGSLAGVGATSSVTNFFIKGTPSLATIFDVASSSLTSFFKVGSDGFVTAPNLIATNSTTTNATTTSLGGTNFTFTNGTTTNFISGAGTVTAPSVAVTGGGGLYSNGSNIIALTNGVSGISFDGTTFYPNTDVVRDLGKTGNSWRNLLVVNATTTAFKFTNATGTVISLTHGTTTNWSATNLNGTSLSYVNSTTTHLSFTDATGTVLALTTATSSTYFGTNAYITGSVGVASNTPMTNLVVATGSIFVSGYVMPTSTTMKIDMATSSNTIAIPIGVSAITISFINVYFGAHKSIQIINPPSGTPGAITWSGVTWTGGTAPTLTATNGRYDWISCLVGVSTTSPYTGTSVGCTQTPNFGQ